MEEENEKEKKQEQLGGASDGGRQGNDTGGSGAEGSGSVGSSDSSNSSDGFNSSNSSDSSNSIAGGGQASGNNGSSTVVNGEGGSTGAVGGSSVGGSSTPGGEAGSNGVIGDSTGSSNSSDSTNSSDSSNIGDSTNNSSGGDATTEEPNYYGNWGEEGFMDALRDPNSAAYGHTIGENFADFNRWAKANGKDPLDVFTMLAAIQGNDMGQSLAANDAARKKQERQQKWEQIGNVLNHLGNFVGTMTGAPAATYESGADLSKRQQAVRDAVLKQRDAAGKNVLAQIWKDRADQRAAEINAAKVALEQARKAGVESDTQNKKALNDATVALRGAQQKQAEAGARRNDATTRYTDERTETEKETRPLKKAQIKSQTNANNARAGASRAQTRATNIRAYGSSYNSDRYKIWAKNRRTHPNESKQFMEDNNIHSWDRKNWTKDLIDQYNGYIADKFSGRRSSGGGAAGLLD